MHKPSSINKLVQFDWADWEQLAKQQPQIYPRRRQMLFETLIQRAPLSRQPRLRHLYTQLSQYDHATEYAPSELFMLYTLIQLAAQNETILQKVSHSLYLALERKNDPLKKTAVIPFKHKYE